MQLIFGVSVTGSAANLALVDATNPSSVLDQSVVDISTDAIEQLRSTIVETDRMLRQDGHHLAATRLSWPNDPRAAELRDTLLNNGVADVSLVSVSDAATAAIRQLGTDAGAQTTALLLVEDETVALSVVGPDSANTSVIAIEPIPLLGAAAACGVLLDRFREESGGAHDIYLISATGSTEPLAAQLGAASPVPVHAVDEPAAALARGAAAIAPDGYAPATTATGIATAMSPQLGDQLAYSMAPDSEPIDLGYSPEIEQYDAGVYTQSSMQALPLNNEPTEFGPAATAAARPARPRILLLGSTIAAMVVTGFAVLAVVVAISIQPTASEQAIRDYESVPGKYLPVMPGQGVDAPVADSAAYLPPVVPVASTRTDPRLSLPGTSTNISPGNSGVNTSSISPGITNPVQVATGVVTDNGVIQPLPDAWSQGFRLIDWLPTGTNLNMDSFASMAGQCTTATCVKIATGCWPWESSCFAEKFYCVLGQPGCGTIISDPICLFGNPNCDDPLENTNQLNITSTEPPTSGSSSESSSSESSTNTSSSTESSTESSTTDSSTTESSPTESSTSTSTETSSTEESTSTEPSTSEPTTTDETTTTTHSSTTTSTSAPTPESIPTSTIPTATQPRITTTTAAPPPQPQPEPEPTFSQPALAPQPEPEPEPVIEAPTPTQQVVVPTQEPVAPTYSPPSVEPTVPSVEIESPATTTVVESLG